MGSVQCVHPLPAACQDQAVQIYAHALAAKLEPLFGPLEESLDFLRQQVDLQRGIGAIQQEQVVGILGLQDHQGGFLCPSLEAMIDHYGLFPSLHKMILLMALDPEVAADELYLDGVAVVETMRGRGIGQQLISAFEQYGRSHGFKRLSLEVIDTNPRARSLYTKLGYQEVSSRSMDLLGDLFPFHVSVRMQKQIP